jgi:hypothetical protein
VNIRSIGLAFLDLCEGFALGLGVAIERPPCAAMP